MTGIVIIMPIVARPSFDDPDWREQFDRECAARCDALRTPPPRTRPILIASVQAAAADIMREG